MACLLCLTCAGRGLHYKSVAVSNDLAMLTGAALVLAFGAALPS